ncbi:MAG: hypothetical protein ACRELB_20510 [Polyangiaceae bacterium]
MPADLRLAVAEALETLLSRTGYEADALFGERVLGDFDEAEPAVARAAGILEGAAIALGMTALELIDSVAAETPPRPPRPSGQP